MGLTFRALDGGRGGAWSLQHGGVSLGARASLVESQLVERTAIIGGSVRSTDYRCAANYSSADNRATDHINSANDRSGGAEDVVRRW